MKIELGFLKTLEGRDYTVIAKTPQEALDAIIREVGDKKTALVNGSIVYEYYLTARPPMPGALPIKGLFLIDEFPERKYCPEIGARAWARLEYTRKLTADEVSNYELKEAD